MSLSGVDLKTPLTSLLKEALGGLASYRPGNSPNVCLFSTRRGGSTWLMEMIAANPGITYSDQPFSIYSASPKQLRYLPVCEAGHLVELDAEGEARVTEYLDLLFRGRMWVNGPWRIWERGFDFRPSRIVLKILAAKALIDLIDRRFDVRVVYSTRHPVPTALSIMRNNWGLTIRAYLNNAHFVENYMSDDQYTCAQDLMRSGNLFRQHVLNWILENLVPLRRLPDRPDWLHVTYEEMVATPAAVALRLAEHLGVTDTRPMLDRVARPSKSTRRSSTKATRDRIRAGDKASLSSRWRDAISDDDARAATDLLEQFDVPVYRESNGSHV